MPSEDILIQIKTSNIQALYDKNRPIFIQYNLDIQSLDKLKDQLDSLLQQVPEKPEWGELTKLDEVKFVFQQSSQLDRIESEMKKIINKELKTPEQIVNERKKAMNDQIDELKQNIPISLLNDEPLLKEFIKLNPFERFNGIEEKRQVMIDFPELEKKFEESVESINALFTLHREAQAIKNAEDFAPVIAKINEGNTGFLEAYAKIDRFWDNKIESHFNELNITGIRVVTNFVENKKFAQVLKEKINNTSLLIEKNIDLNIVNKPEIMAVIRQFSGLDIPITQEMVDDNLFIKTIDMLTKLNIDITGELIESIHTDTTRWNLIHYEYHRNQNTNIALGDSLRQDQLTAFVNKIINADPATIHAMDFVITKQKDLYHPALLIGLEQEPLKTIFAEASQSRISSNVRILNAILDATDKLASSQKLQSSSLEGGPLYEKKMEMLILLANANNDLNDKELNKRAKMITYISDFEKTYPSSNSLKNVFNVNDNLVLQNSLHNVTQLSINRILQPGELNPEALIADAKEQFPPRHRNRVFIDVLQCISGAFILVMPIRLLCNKSPLFSLKKTERETAFKDYIRDMEKVQTHDNEEAEELDNDDEEQVHNIQPR